MSYFNEVLRAAFIFILSLAVTAGYGLGMYMLGSRTASTEIYQQQNADLKLLIGIVDQAKARELASCADSGRSDCLATVGGAQ